MAQSMSLYYAQYPTVGLKSLATLFAFLTEQKEFILQQSVSSPLSGAGTSAPAPAKTSNNNNQNAKDKGPRKLNATRQNRLPKGQVCRGPKRATTFSAAPTPDPLATSHVEITPGYMGNSPVYGASAKELPVYPPYLF
jgi:hypothetical protein